MPYVDQSDWNSQRSAFFCLISAGSKGLHHHTLIHTRIVYPCDNPLQLIIMKYSFVQVVNLPKLNTSQWMSMAECEPWQSGSRTNITNEGIYLIHFYSHWDSSYYSAQGILKCALLLFLLQYALRLCILNDTQLNMACTVTPVRQLKCLVLPTMSDSSFSERRSIPLPIELLTLNRSNHSTGLFHPPVLPG